MIHVIKSDSLGQGASKNAYTIAVDPTNSPTSFTLPAGSDINKYCLVEYRRIVNWRKDGGSSVDENFKEFRKKIATDPEFRYNVDTDNYFFEIMMYPLKVQEYKYNKNLYQHHKQQFECIEELKKMYDLSKENEKGISFAPKIHQIHIHKLVDTQEKITELPFSPENMDEEFDKIPSGPVKVSYLVERCGEDIFEYIHKNPDKKNETGLRVIEFIDMYVESKNELNTDIKPANFCPTIADDGTAMRLLDVDPLFCIGGTGEEFKENAKVFMKYLFIVNAVKYRRKINFGNLGITQSQIDTMIQFFFNPKYFIYRRNPMNMLYHYFVWEHPGHFLSQIQLPQGWKTKISKTTGKKYYQTLDGSHKQYNYPIKYEFLNYGEIEQYFNPKNFILLLHQLNAEHNIFITDPHTSYEKPKEETYGIFAQMVNNNTLPEKKNVEDKNYFNSASEVKGGKKHKSRRRNWLKKNKKTRRRK